MHSCLHVASDLLIPRDVQTSTRDHQEHQPHSLAAALDLFGVACTSLESRLPPGFSGPKDLPCPLLMKLTAKVVYRGINLLERERRYEEALHYCSLLLDATADRVSSFIEGRRPTC